MSKMKLKLFSIGNTHFYSNGASIRFFVSTLLRDDMRPRMKNGNNNEISDGVSVLLVVH